MIQLGVRGVVVSSLGSSLAVLTALPALAAEPLPPEWEERVVDYVQNEMAAFGMPGTSVAIVHDSQVVFAKGFGVADPGGRPVTAETPFPIASVSKSLTALAVMQLVETGALELNDTLASLIPDQSIVGCALERDERACWHVRSVALSWGALNTVVPTYVVVGPSYDLGADVPAGTGVWSAACGRLRFSCHHENRIGGGSGLWPGIGPPRVG